MKKYESIDELYKNTEEWHLAWKTYKYINRNPQLRESAVYRKIEAFTEDLIIHHRLLSNDRTYEEIQDFYRFFVTLENRCEKQDFVLPETVIKHYEQLINTFCCAK